jgi:hypothetical protein
MLLVTLGSCKSDSYRGRKVAVNVGRQRTVMSDSIRHYLLHVSWSLFGRPKVSEVWHTWTLRSVNGGCVAGHYWCICVLGLLASVTGGS